MASDSDSLTPKRPKPAPTNSQLPQRLELVVESSPAAVSGAVAALKNFLACAIEAQELAPYELALGEALRNALEHGNLGFSVDEKIRFCEAETFESEVHARSLRAQDQGKHIYVSAELEAQRFCCTITDEGPGFHWCETPDPLADASARTGLRGRGLFLIRNFFDAVRFNEKGNSVVLEKHLSVKG